MSAPRSATWTRRPGRCAKRRSRCSALLEKGLKPSTVVEWSRRLKRVVASFRPDVIHAQSVTSALAARLAAPRVPLLVTIHGISKSNEPVASVLLRAANVRLTAVSEAAAAGLLRHSWAPPVDILGPGIDIDQIERQAQVPDPPALVGEARAWSASPGRIM